MGRRSRPGILPHNLVILHEDPDILVVDKPAGTLDHRHREGTSCTPPTSSRRITFARAAPAPETACSSCIGWTGRLPGFSSSPKAKRRSSGCRASGARRRRSILPSFTAIARISRETITTYLAENKAHVMYSTSDSAMGKLSHTAYRVLKQTEDFALLEVSLLTGRKNQIRVHLAGIGHPIVGDRKYGSAKESHAGLALHAKSISFRHPVSGQRLTFAAKVPAYFHKLVGSIAQP